MELVVDKLILYIVNNINIICLQCVVSLIIYLLLLVIIIQSIVGAGAFRVLPPTVQTNFFRFYGVFFLKVLFTKLKDSRLLGRSMPWLVQLHPLALWIAVEDLHSKILDALPSGSKLFQFHAVLGKFWQSCMLAPPPRYTLASPPPTAGSAALGSTADHESVTTAIYFEVVLVNVRGCHPSGFFLCCRMGTCNGCHN